MLAQFHSREVHYPETLYNMVDAQNVLPRPHRPGVGNQVYNS